MNIALWILQVLLAVAFLAHGGLMLFPPPDILALMNESMSTGLRFFIGIAEVAAAIGLTLPGITRIMPGFVPAAAAGLMIVMISATIFHVYRGETSSAITTAVLLLIATFVAYQRWKVNPILPRGSVISEVR
jgi:uncharacterized membrane protein YphA (DoxX/SURF4 family)